MRPTPLCTPRASSSGSERGSATLGVSVRCAPGCRSYPVCNRKGSCFRQQCHRQIALALAESAPPSPSRPSHDPGWFISLRRSCHFRYGCALCDRAARNDARRSSARATSWHGPDSICSESPSPLLIGSSDLLRGTSHASAHCTV
jgi:hypothetical protein